MVRFILTLISLVYGIFCFYCILYVPNYTGIIIQAGILAYLIIFPAFVLVYYVLLKLISLFVKDLQKEVDKNK